MKIKELTLKNFKSVVDQSFRFKDGITCFSGNNGEGKSTVIHAMLIMLFNSYDLTFKDYINWNATKFVITMLFEHEGKEFYEEFEYSEKGGSKRVLRNTQTNEVWENSAALSVLADIIDPDLAKASIVAMENEQNLITTTPAKRREYLKGVYNLEFKEQVDSIAKDLEKAGEDEIRYNSDIAALERQVFEHKQYTDLAYSETEYQQAKDEINVLEAKKGELELQKQRRDIVMSKLDEANLGIRKCVSQSAVIDSKIKSLEEDIQASERDLAKEETEDKLPELTEKVNSLKSEHLQALDKYNAEIADYKKQLEDLHATADFQESIKETDEKIRTKEREQGDAQVLIRQSRAKLNVLKTGKCPTCGHVVSEEEVEAENKVLWDLEQQDAKFDADLTVLKNTLDGFKKDQNAWELRVQAVQNLLANSENQLNSSSARYSRDILNAEHEAEMYRSNKENVVSLLKANINNTNRMLESQKDVLEQTQSFLDQYRSSAASLSQELESMDDPKSAIEEIRSEISGLRSAVSTYENAVNYNKWVDEYNKDQDEKQARRDAEIDALRKQLQGLAERKAMLEKAKTIVAREFPSFVISYMVKSLENHTNEFLQKVYPKYEIKITESKNSLAITYGPRDADVKMASGFEKSAFSLAYMYALGKMQKYGLLIIDEGDGAASDANSLQFYNTVAKSQEFFPQIFCITHKEVAKDLLENTYHADVYIAEGGCYYKS